MLVPIAPKVRKRRERKKGKKASPPPPPPSPDVLVLKVTPAVGDSYSAEFEFNHPVTTDGSAAPEVIVDMYDFGSEYAIASLQVTPFVVRYTFPDDQVVPGAAWTITGPPTGLDLDGRTMPTPQMGGVEE